MVRALFAVALVLLGALPALAGTWGWGALFGNSYTPDAEVGFHGVQAVWSAPYAAVMGHRAPEALLFKAEGTVGLATAPGPKGWAAANILAHYRLPALRFGAFTPYGEAGIGLVYTAFRREDQGLRLNFNPVAGVGAAHASGWFAALRFFHLSNGGLDHENTGINAAFLQVGRRFGR